MTKSDTKVVYVALFLVVVVVAAYFYKITTTTTQEEALKSFVSLTESDPLFYSPFYDAELYKKELERLRQSELMLLDIAKKNINESNINTELYNKAFADFELYPYTYLELLPEISVSTDALLASPSVKNAEALLDLYTEAAQAYQNSIERHLKTLDIIHGELKLSELPLYFFVDSVTSVETTYNDFSLIQKNAKALQAEIDQRKMCLRGKSVCNNTSPLSTEFGIKADVFEAEVPDTKNSRTVLANIPYPELIVRKGGPYRVASSCWDTEDDADLVYLITYEDRDEIFAVMPKLVTQTYYTVVPKEPETAIYAYLRSKRVDFYSQLAGSMYQCTDLTFYPYLLAADYVAKQAERVGVAPSTLLDDYQQLTMNQFGLLAPAFDVIGNNLDLVRDTQYINADSIVSPQFLLSTRSAYSIVFMPYARSVWRINEQPQYLLPKTETLFRRIKMDHVNLTDLETLGYTEEEISTFHYTQRDYTTELLEQKSE